MTPTKREKSEKNEKENPADEEPKSDYPFDQITIDTLPDEILLDVIYHLNVRDQLAFALTYKRGRSLSKDPSTKLSVHKQLIDERNQWTFENTDEKFITDNNLQPKVQALLQAIMEHSDQPSTELLKKLQLPTKRELAEINKDTLVKLQSIFLSPQVSFYLEHSKKLRTDRCHRFLRSYIKEVFRAVANNALRLLHKHHEAWKQPNSRPKSFTEITAMTIALGFSLRLDVFDDGEAKIIEIRHMIMEAKKLLMQASVDLVQAIIGCFEAPGRSRYSVQGLHNLLSCPIAPGSLIDNSSIDEMLLASIKKLELEGIQTSLRKFSAIVNKMVMAAQSYEQSARSSLRKFFHNLRMVLSPEDAYPPIDLASILAAAEAYQIALIDLEQHPVQQHPRDKAEILEQIETLMAKLLGLLFRYQEQLHKRLNLSEKAQYSEALVLLNFKPTIANLAKNQKL